MEEKLTAHVWRSYFDSEGRNGHEYQCRKAVFHHGVAAEVRAEVWLYLLDVYPFNSTTAERATIKADLTAKYAALTSKWKRCEELFDPIFLKAKKKDVLRNDRDHPFYTGDDNPNLRMLRGVLLAHTVHDKKLEYSQGMNDLVSPILVIIQDEVLGFWAWASYMKRMRDNFMDMSMSEGSLRTITQHYDAALAQKLESVAHGGSWNFAYRWMLMDFKREFPFGEIPALWERIWAKFATSHFHVFVGLGILLVHRTKLMAITDELDLQMYLKEITMKTDLQAVLREAIAALDRLKCGSGSKKIPPELQSYITPPGGGTFVKGSPVLGHKHAPAAPGVFPVPPRSPGGVGGSSPGGLGPPPAASAKLLPPPPPTSRLVNVGSSYGSIAAASASSPLRPPPQVWRKYVAASGHPFYKDKDQLSNTAVWQLPRPVLSSWMLKQRRSTFA
eukprot:gene7449-28737_t